MRLPPILGEHCALPSENDCAHEAVAVSGNVPPPPPQRISSDSLPAQHQLTSLDQLYYVFELRQAIYEQERHLRSND